MSQLNNISIPIRDFPPVVAEMLEKGDKVSLILEKDATSGEARVGVRRVYSDRAYQFLQEAKIRAKQPGNRDELFRRFESAKKKISDLA